MITSTETLGFLGGSSGKESACNVGDLSSIPGLGRSPGEGKGYPLTMNKASGGDGIPGEVFHVLKDDAVKVLHSVCQQIWKTQQWPQDWKRTVFIPVPKKGNSKECSNYYAILLNPHVIKVMLKMLQTRLQQ